MKKWYILGGFLVVAVVFTLGYFGRQPALLYIGRLTQNKIARIGWVSGEQIVRLNVPFHRQEHSLSCEIASLQMALAGVGINVPESELISHLDFDPTAKSGGVWGDPYKGFVGSVDGAMPRTGYGVYWDPIAKLGLRYTRTRVITDGTLQHLTAQIDAGRPVVVWGHFGNGSKFSWRTPEGRVITAVSGEHARTLIGYIGSSDNPEKLIVMDPIYGEERWSAADFMDNWLDIERGAVAVYPFPRWAKSDDSQTIWEISTDGKQKYGITMTWESFVSQGGSAEAIIPVDAAFLGSLEYGGNLQSLPPT
jgi:uncharacterized protein YvpB